MTFLASPHRLISVCNVEKKGAGAAVLQIAPKHRAAEGEKTDKQRAMLLGQAELLAGFMQRKVRHRRVQRQIAREEQAHIIIVRVIVAYMVRKLTLEEEKKDNLQKKVLTVSSTVAGRQNASKLNTRKQRKGPAAAAQTGGIRAISGWRRVQAGGRAAQAAKKFQTAGQSADQTAAQAAGQATGQATGQGEMKPATPVMQRATKKVAGRKLASHDEVDLKAGARATLAANAKGAKAGIRARVAIPARQSTKGERAPATDPNGQARSKGQVLSDYTPPPRSELPLPPANRFRARQLAT